MDELNKKKTASLEEESQELVKEAGIIDTLINIGTKRGWSLAAWERKYPKRFKSLRDKGNRLINDAEKVLEHTISCLKKMATARAIRRPDSYVEESGKIRGLFTKFDAEFQSYYNTEVKEILELKAQYDAKKPEEKAPEAPVAQPPAAPPAAKEEEKAPDTQRKPQVPPTTPAGVPAMPGGTEGPPKPKTEEEKKSSAHQNFYESLQAMSQESPLILAKYIAKYAASIQTTDPETAVNLFGIAKQIKG